VSGNHKCAATGVALARVRTLGLGRALSRAPDRGHASCQMCFSLLVRASAALQRAAADLDLLAALAQDPALAADAPVLADAIDAEFEALDAVLARHARV
jgi:hypothetical protein